jgi:hypothetical protein
LEVFILWDWTPHHLSIVIRREVPFEKLRNELYGVDSWSFGGNANNES